MKCIQKALQVVICVFAVCQPIKAQEYIGMSAREQIGTLHSNLHTLPNLFENTKEPTLAAPADSPMANYLQSTFGYCFCYLMEYKFIPNVGCAGQGASGFENVNITYFSVGQPPCSRASTTRDWSADLFVMVVDQCGNYIRSGYSYNQGYGNTVTIYSGPFASPTVVSISQSCQ